MMALGPRKTSGGMLMKHDGNGPIMRGMFTLTTADLKVLVDKVKNNQEATFQLVMWDKKKSAAGNMYYGLSIEKEMEKPKPKQEEGSSFFGGDPDDEIPF